MGCAFRFFCFHLSASTLFFTFSISPSLLGLGFSPSVSDMLAEGLESIYAPRPRSGGGRVLCALEVQQYV